MSNKNILNSNFNALLTSLHSTIKNITSFTVFGKGERMWIKRVLQNKSAVSKMLCLSSRHV